MQRFTIEAQGREYSLISLPSPEQIPSPSEIILYPWDGEKADFEFDFCDTPPEMCAILIGYFLFFHRGLPIDTLTLYARGREYCVEREGAYVFYSLSPEKPLIKSGVFLGCEIEFADCEGKRASYFENLEKVDRRVLSALLLSGDKTESRRLLALGGEGDSVRLEYENPLGFEELSFIAGFLLSRGIFSRGRLNLHHKGRTLVYIYRDGAVKIGISPKIKK